MKDKEAKVHPAPLSFTRSFLLILIMVFILFFRDEKEYQPLINNFTLILSSILFIIAIYALYKGYIKKKNNSNNWKEIINIDYYLIIIQIIISIIIIFQTISIMS